MAIDTGVLGSGASTFLRQQRTTKRMNRSAKPAPPIAIPTIAPTPNEPVDVSEVAVAVDVDESAYETMTELDAPPSSPVEVDEYGVDE